MAMTIMQSCSYNLLASWLYLQFLQTNYCKNTIKINISVASFQKFPGGMPPDPLALACYAC